MTKSYSNDLKPILIEYLDERSFYGEVSKLFKRK